MKELFIEWGYRVVTEQKIMESRECSYVTNSNDKKGQEYLSEFDADPVHKSVKIWNSAVGVGLRVVDTKCCF